MHIRSLTHAALMAVCSLVLAAPALSASAEAACGRGGGRGGSGGQGVGQFCGGLANIRCPEGLVCVDDPRDECDPAQGGADCGGICRPETGGQAQCTGNEPGLQYVSRSPSECAALLFDCPAGSSPFFNECGCGCQQDTGGTACPGEESGRTYVSRDPEQCAAIRFACVEGTQPFFDECGCGCEPIPQR